MAEVVGLASSIIAIIQITTKITTLAYKYTNDIQKAPKYIRALLDEIKSLLVILNTLEECREKSPHLDVIQKLERPLNECLLEMKTLAKTLESRVNEARSWKRFIIRLKWPLDDREMSECLARIERFKSTAQLAISIAKLPQAQLVRGTGQGLHYLDEPESGSLVEAKVLIDEKRKLILHWLYSQSVDRRHDEIVKKRRIDTGQPVIEAPEFKNWAGNGTASILWVYGLPGAGKTFMTSFVIDYLSKGAYGVAYTYFDYKDQDRQKPTFVLASLVKQLALQRTQTLPKELEYVYDELSYQQKRPSIEQLYRVLLKFTRLFDKTFVVCDALDEYQDPLGQFLPLFHRMKSDGIRLLLTSRQDCDNLNNIFRDSEKVQFCATDNAIRSYIEQSISDLDISKEDRHEIAVELTGRTDEIFLWAHLYTKRLCELNGRGQILGQLKTLKDSVTKGPAKDRNSPLDLIYNDYKTAFYRQRQESIDLGLKILTWLVKSRRPLRVCELQDAVSMHMRSRKGGNLYGTNPLDKDMILNVCANFVMIEESGEGVDDTIKLIHYTVQEFLLRCSMLPNNADLEVALTCISYLSLEVFMQGPCATNGALESRRKMHPFHNYASENLPRHLKSCDETSTTNVVLDFLKKPGCVKSYLQALHCEAPPPNIAKEIEYHDRYPKGRTPLHTAASLGHLSVTQKLLKKSKAGENTLDEEGKTPILVAVEEGHEKIVRMLFEKGADPSISDKRGITPLHASVSLEDETGRILKFLLENNPNQSVVDMRDSTPLHWAASRGFKLKTDVLSEGGKGAAISPPNNIGNTPLHIAVEYGYQSVVQLLLEKGADITAQNHKGNTALHLAAYGGELEVVHMLLENDNKAIFVRNKEECTSLHLAASSGNREVVKTLIKLGAGVLIMSKDTSGWTALYYAAKNGHEAVVRVLLDHNAKPFSIDNGGTPILHRAAPYGPIVKLLLKNGADIASRDSRGRTVLHWACSLGVLDTVALLLDNGANPYYVDDDGRTALHYAAFEGHNSVVKLLIEKGSNTSAVDNRGQTAYQVAVLKNHDTSITQLLKVENPR